MKSSRRIAIALTSLTTLALLALAPVTPASATTPVFTVSNSTGYRYEIYCTITSPGPCTTESGPSGHTQLYIDVTLNFDPTSTVTYTWALTNGTAKVGTDFLGPSTGTGYMGPNGDNAPGDDLIDVPVIDNGATNARTFTAKVTSSSIGGDISSVGTETIEPGAEIPSDCTLYWVSSTSKSLTCTGRPAGQKWYFQMICLKGFAGISENGNTVTGDGTSLATCPFYFPDAEDTGLFLTS